MDNYLEEMLAFVYYGSIVNNRPKKGGDATKHIHLSKALTHLCRVDFYLHSSDRSISNNRGIWLVPCFLEIPEFSAKSIYVCSVASELGLYCLPMSFLWDVRHTLV